MIRYKTNRLVKLESAMFESFVNLIRYKTKSRQMTAIVRFESFVNLIRYKTITGNPGTDMGLRALLI